MASQPRSRSTFVALVAVLIVASMLVAAPFAAVLIMAAWVADFTRPLAIRLARGSASRKRTAAAAVVAIIVCAVVVPVGFAAIAAIAQAKRAIALLVAASEGNHEGDLAPDPAPRLPSLAELERLAKEHAKDLWKIAHDALGASTGLAIGVLIFLLAVYAMLSDGRAAYVWLARRSPVGARTFTRLAGAFRETGRGLLVGTGATVLVQGIIAAVTYLALGVAAAVPLAFLTAMAGLMPVLGTMLVWGPVAVGLALAGHPVRAIILVIVGLGVIGLVDNLVRPLTARFGKLDMPPFVLIISLLGGVTVLGASGLVLGPLIVRLTMEALELARERGTFSRE